MHTWPTIYMPKIKQPYCLRPTLRRAPSNLGSCVSRAPKAAPHRTAPDKNTSGPAPRPFFPALLCTPLSFSLVPPPTPARQSESAVSPVPPSTAVSIRAQRYLSPTPSSRRRFGATMTAEGEAKNPSAGGGGDNPQHQQAAPAPAPAQGEVAQEAAVQGTGQEQERDKADREVQGGAGEKDDGACRDLVLVEDPEVLAVEDPEEGTAPVLADSLFLSSVMALVVLAAPVAGR
jgi:hypothetical protein